MEKDSRHVEEEACSADQTEAEAEAEAEADAEDGLWTWQGRCAAQAAARTAACTGLHTPESVRPIPMQLVVVGVSTGGEVAELLAW